MGRVGGMALWGIVGLLAGCATPSPMDNEVMRWAKPGATFEQYMQERYVCAQEASRQRASGQANAYGAASQSRPTISLSLFRACMGAKGWRQSPEGYRPPPGDLIMMED